jgi:hypothetical protein
MRNVVTSNSTLARTAFPALYIDRVDQRVWRYGRRDVKPKLIEGLRSRLIHRLPGVDSQSPRHAPPVPAGTNNSTERG